MYKWSDFHIHIDTEAFAADSILHAACPQCSISHLSGSALVIYLRSSQWFCQHCGFAGNLIEGILNSGPASSTASGNKNYNPRLASSYQWVPLGISAIESFKKRGISQQTLEHFKIGQTSAYFPEQKSFKSCLVFPYFKDNQELSALVYSYGKNRSYEKASEHLCFNYNAIDKEHTYIVFDEMEALALHEAEQMHVISLFGGSLPEGLDNTITPTTDTITRALDFLPAIESKIKEVKKIIVAFPNTEAAKAVSAELVRRLGKEKCWTVEPPQEGYSWIDVLSEYGKDKTRSLLATAKPIPVRGIFELSDIEEELDYLYYNGLRRGNSTGFDSLDDFYTVVPGQWTVVTGIPGHGKSNFLDAVLVNLAKYSDWNFAIFSPENQPIARHFASIMEKYWESPFDLGKNNRITEIQKEEGKRWLDKHFSVLLPHEDDSWSIDGVLELAKIAVFRKGIKGLVMDPWNELDHSRPSNQTETEYVSSALTKLRQFARTYDVHVWLVAHPAKLYKDKDGKYPVPTPYDISGSAHYRNKADNAITVWRNVGHDDQDVADIHVQKIRFKEVGRVGLVSLRFDSYNGSFVDDIDQQKRQNALNSGEVVKTQEIRKRTWE